MQRWYNCKKLKQRPNEVIFMKKKRGWIIGALCAVLLLGSFPARAFWGTVVCDVMRLVGFGALLFWIVTRPHTK